MKIILPVRTVSEANRRDHWARRARRANSQRWATRVCLNSEIAVRGGHPPAPPLAITLIRVAPRRLDTDNLAGALKAVRDGIADALGINDGDPRITWHYGQRRGRTREYAVEVEIKPVGEEA